MDRKEQREQAKIHIDEMKGWIEWYEDGGDDENVLEIKKQLFHYKCFLVEMQIAYPSEIDEWINN